MQCHFFLFKHLKSCFPLVINIKQAHLSSVFFPSLYIKPLLRQSYVTCVISSSRFFHFYAFLAGVFIMYSVSENVHGWHSFWVCIFNSWFLLTLHMIAYVYSREKWVANNGEKQRRVLLPPTSSLVTLVAFCCFRTYFPCRRTLWSCADQYMCLFKLIRFT